MQLFCIRGLNFWEMLFLIRKNFAWLVIVTATLIVILSAYTYNAISSKLIFKESATHLNEIYSQVGNSLSNLLSENWNAMDMWIPYLEDTDDDKKIRTYIETSDVSVHSRIFTFLIRTEAIVRLTVIPAGWISDGI